MRFMLFTNLSEELRELYHDWGIERYFDDDIKYFRQAFSFTSELWHTQYRLIENIKFVMIAEAPLYGDNKSYFYNPEADFTPFFWFNDIEAFLEEGIEQNYQTTVEKKQYVLEILKRKGFIIIDLFPFALNDNDTHINYQSLTNSKYLSLLEKSYTGYLKPTLQLIRDKSHSQIRFFYRYRRVKNRVDDFVSKKLMENRLIQQTDEIATIGGTNHPLNKNLLTEIIQQDC